MSIQIVHLRDAMSLFPDVADRIWRAWSKPCGESLAEVEQELAGVVAAATFPFTLVATSDGVFAGTVTAIATDLDERPELTPWIASLWVDPPFRGSGIARALVDRATMAMFAQGFPHIYLYAIPELRTFYRHLGWHLQEERFGKLGVDIFIRRAPAASSPS